MIRTASSRRERRSLYKNADTRRASASEEEGSAQPERFKDRRAGAQRTGSTVSRTAARAALHSDTNLVPLAEPRRGSASGSIESTPITPRSRRIASFRCEALRAFIRPPAANRLGHRRGVDVERESRGEKPRESPLDAATSMEIGRRRWRCSKGGQIFNCPQESSSTDPLNVGEEEASAEDTC